MASLIERAVEIAKQSHQDRIVQFLLGGGQEHARIKLAEEILDFEIEYHGGMTLYSNKVIELMNECIEGKTKYDNTVLMAPDTVNLSWNELDNLRKADLMGIPELKKCAFFLLAGGLGERLGYHGAKPCMKVDSVSLVTFLDLYCSYIREYQNLFLPEIVTLPFVMMVVEETDSDIRRLLEEHNYFGLKLEQFHLIRQRRVPAILNLKGEVEFNLETGEILSKPHGHGECHLLMHKSGLAEKFRQQGLDWLIFFNDTNPLAFRFLPSYLGVGRQKDWETFYICIKRKPGEALGGVSQLVTEGREVITNVEYNVLDKLAKHHPEPVDAEGFSRLPGNVNMIVISLKTYADILKVTHGLVPEFINPKFKEDGVTLKSPTRMETLISEYTYLLPDCKRVGAIQCERLMCFTCAKNEIALGRQRQAAGLSIETCGSCQFDYYLHHRILLEKLGVKVAGAANNQNLGGITYEVGPRIVLHPSFGVTLRDLEQNIGPNVEISANSYLELDGKARLENLKIDGSYKVVNKTQGQLTLAQSDLKQTAYVTFADVSTATNPSYEETVRGFCTINADKIQTISK